MMSDKVTKNITSDYDRTLHHSGEHLHYKNTTHCNPSKMDPIGVLRFVLYKEVSLIQGF